MGVQGALPPGGSEVGSYVYEQVTNLIHTGIVFLAGESFVS